MEDRARSVPNLSVCVVAIAMASALGGCVTSDRDAGRYEFERPQMGTVFRVVMYAESPAQAQQAAEAAFARVEELNKTLSDYDPDSELSRLSRTAGSGQAVPVGDDLWTMLEASRTISMHTAGAFDITVGPIVKLWRRARRQGELPGPDQLAEARAAVGYQKLVLNPKHKTAMLTTPGMKLDLGGIAKGFACDEGLKVLRRHGIDRAMVIGGGDVVAGDPPPKKLGWTIEMSPLGRPYSAAAKQDDPTSPAQTRPSGYLLLRNAAVSTSGDAFQYVEINGTRYSHIVDPRTGIGLTTPMGVTVVARDGTTADAYATALNVLGPRQGLRLIDSVPEAVAIFTVLNDQGRPEIFRSTRASELVIKPAP